MGSSAPRASASCVPSAWRSTLIEAAWPDGDRIGICTKCPADAVPRCPDAARSCVSVGPSGDYRREGDALGPPPHPLPAVPYRRASADGRLEFSLTGGNAGRKGEPHGAVGTVRDARTRRVLKQAPAEYDEHLEFLGWVGQNLVLETWVDEGPGCVVRLEDPDKSWPIAASSIHEPLIDCFGGGPDGAPAWGRGNVVLKPAEGVFAIVDAGGAAVVFVDESSSVVTRLETGLSAGPEMGARILGWLEGEERLVLVYGAPSSGDVARIDLKRRVLVSKSSPSVCP